MAELFSLARRWEEQPGILNVSIFGGFPYCDFAGVGLSVVTTADGDRALADACSSAIAARAWEIREQFLKDVPTCEEALDRTLELLSSGRELAGPIVLADVADNPTGGGSGDTTVLLQELLRRGVERVAVACIHDPESVQQAKRIGVGNSGSLAIGGKGPIEYGAPLQVEGTVRALTDGRFVSKSQVSRGSQSMGETAVIETGGLKLVITTDRHACIDPEVFQSVGIDPLEQAVIVVKSRGHFRAAFEPIASTILEVGAPGATSTNLHHFPYRNIPRPIWPLDDPDGERKGAQCR